MSQYRLTGGVSPPCRLATVYAMTSFDGTLITSIGNMRPKLPVSTYICVRTSQLLKYLAFLAHIHDADDVS